jgi:hypothetical protein
MLKQLFVCFLILGLYQCSKKVKVSSLSGSLQENTSIITNTSITTTTSTNTTLSSSDFCPSKNNCLFYGVEKLLDKYDCLICKKDYMLTFDNQTKAICNEKNTINNCDRAIKKSDINDGKPICFSCEKDFALKEDKECIKTPDDKKVQNCRDYEFLENEYICMNCEQGYNLDDKNNKCIQGCKIPNCETCRIMNNKEYCMHCLPNMIGLFDDNTDSFKSCMTCDEYKLKLKSSNSSYIPNFSS